jgi:hypothetical protein
VPLLAPSTITLFRRIYSKLTDKTSVCFTTNCLQLPSSIHTGHSLHRRSNRNYIFCQSSFAMALCRPQQHLRMGYRLELCDVQRLSPSYRVDSYHPGSRPYSRVPCPFLLEYVPPRYYPAQYIGNSKIDPNPWKRLRKAYILWGFLVSFNRTDKVKH